MVEAIVERLRPTRIILFGSRARADARDDSDYDLLVELEYDDYYDCQRAVWAALEPARPRGRDVDVIVRKPGELEARCRDPGWMDWDIIREGVVLYPPNALPLAPPPKRVREGSGETPASVAGWLERAAVDLEVVEKCLIGHAIPWGGVAFHAQQAAEKYLKALLIKRMVRPPRTHLLDELLAAVCEAGYAMPNLDAECEVLNGYAVDIRYPERVPIPTEQQGRAALAAGRRIVALAAPHLT